MNKRDFIKTSVVFGAGAIFSAPVISSCANTQAVGTGLLASFIPSEPDGFIQKKLPYEFNALEPYIDQQTMELHYGKHHAGYTKKFNAAIADEGIDTLDIKEIFANVSKYGSGIRNNGGGYYNHALYFNFMSPDGGGEPSGALMTGINEAFGSFGKFKELFSSAAATQFGSGWAWLIINESGKLQVISTSNQDNPLMDIAEVKGTPILNIDVWEHAYYLNYQNRRTEYISNFWNIINWDAVSQIYKENT